MAGSAVVDVRNSFGAAFIGLLISTVLFGVTIAQTWIYFWHYGKKDPKALKFLIAFVTVMDTLHTITCAFMIYWCLVPNFGNLESLSGRVWVGALETQANISGFCTSAVIFYYARRIYILSKSIFLSMVIVVIVLCGDAIAIYLFVQNFGNKYMSQRLQQSLARTETIGLWMYVVVDALVAAMMCWFLYHKKTGIARTDSMIMTLMAYTINTGLMSCLLGTAMSVSFVVAPSTMFSLAFFVVSSKCYVCSLLAMLNSRDYIRDRSTADHPDDSLTLSSIRIDAPREAHGVSVTMHRSTALDFAPSKSDHNIGPAFEVPKPDITSQCPSQASDVGSSHDHGAT